MVVSMQAIFDHDRIFSALADATRRDIVRRAIDGGEGVAELANHYPMTALISDDTKEIHR